MRNITVSIFFIVALLLAGCVGANTKDGGAESEAKRIAHDRVLCQNYGFGKSAEDLGHCMQVLAERRAQKARDD
jgi:hypothetical protein